MLSFKKMFFHFPSLEKLRTKSGKTMVALCVMAGHKQIFTEGQRPSV